jgi:hypothetical protein
VRVPAGSCSALGSGGLAALAGRLPVGVAWGSAPGLGFSGRSDEPAGSGRATWNQMEPSGAGCGPGVTGRAGGGVAAAGSGGSLGLGGSLFGETGLAAGAWACCLARAAAIFASSGGCAVGLPCRLPGCSAGAG